MPAGAAMTGWLAGANVGHVGAAADLTYDAAHAGTGRKALADLLEHDFHRVLDEDSVVVVGQGALIGADGEAALAHAMELATRSKSKLLVLHSAASRVGAMDVGATCESGVEAALVIAKVIYCTRWTGNTSPAPHWMFSHRSRYR